MTGSVIDGSHAMAPEKLELRCEPLTRTTLALYCGASGDHHPLHIDIDWVRENTDFTDVIGHGMLTMAYMGRVLTDRFTVERVASLQARFLAPSAVGDTITCTAGKSSQSGDGGTDTIEYRIRAENQDGKVLAEGVAHIRSAPR